MDINDISKVANRKRLHVDAEKLREKVTRETTKIIKLKVAQDTAYWDLKEKLQQVEGNHERLQQNMVEVQMQHEAISGQYQDELRLRPETLNKLSSTREICDVLEEYSERLKETVSRCKIDQGALCEAYQRSGVTARELQARHAAQALADGHQVARLEEKVKLLTEHQSQLGQHWAAARAQAAADAAAARQHAAQLQAALADANAALDATRHDLAKKEDSLLELQNEMKKMLQEFDHQADEMKSMIVKQDKDLKEASESNEVLTKALANQEEFTKSVCEVNTQLKDKISGLEDDYAAATNKIKNLDTALEAASSEKNNLNNDIEVFMKQKEQLETAAKNKNEQITELETKIQKMNEQMSALEGVKQEISEELNRVKEECASKATRIEDLEKMGEEQTQKIELLEEELAKEKAAAVEAREESARCAAETERELNDKARTIGQLMGDVKAHSDARARLDAALAAARRDQAAQAARHDALDQEKEAELSKQMSIILETRAEKERLQLKIESMQNTIDNVQKELTRPMAPRPPPADQDDNALMCPPPNKDTPFSPPLTSTEPKQLESMLFNLFSDSSMEGDTLDPSEVSRRFVALSRGERVAPAPLGTLRRRRAAAHRHRAAGAGDQDHILSLSQVKNDLKNKERLFFKNKRSDNKVKNIK